MRLGRLACMMGLLALAGCQQEMAAQPSYRPLVPSRDFPRGMSARLLPEGVVAREWESSDAPTVHGLKAEFREQSPPVDGEVKPTPDAPVDPSRFAALFPFEITKADLRRGQERYTIYCALCHDPVGTGRGKIVERGYLKPPNFHTDDSRGFARYGKSIPLKDVSIGYIFDVITNGYAGMPRYAPQVDAADRWRIIAYLRALQLSQHAAIDDLPPSAKQTASDALGGRP